MVRADSILTDPAWFPDRLDPAGRLVRLVRTDRSILRSSAFLDGRTPLSDGSAPDRIVPLADFVAAQPDPAPIRWIFHEGFCGSTLLARLIDGPDHALCLREPQILVDLAIWRDDIEPGDTALFRTACQAVIAKLSQSWSVHEPVVIKPTNWINPAVSLFWTPERGDRALLVGADTPTFLVAVLRGGRDRIAFVLGLYERFARAWPALARRIEAALPASADAMTRAADLVVATHWFQRVVLGGRERACGTAAVRLRFPAFLDRIGDTLTIADRSLGLTRSKTALAAATATTRFHAKIAGAPAPGADEVASNARVREAHASSIEAALGFARVLEPLRDEAMEEVARSMSPPAAAVFGHRMMKEG